MYPGIPQWDEIANSWEKRLTASRHKMDITHHGATTHKSRLKEDFLASSPHPTRNITVYISDVIENHNSIVLLLSSLIQTRDKPQMFFFLYASFTLSFRLTFF